jgi:hypothetical protein
MKIIVHPEASKEIAEAVHWYEEQQSGLGKTFALDTESAIASRRYRPIPSASQAGLASSFAAHLTVVTNGKAA